MDVPTLRCADAPNTPKNAMGAIYGKNGTIFWTFGFRNGFSNLKLCKNAVQSFGVYFESDLFDSFGVGS